MRGVGAGLRGAFLPFLGLVGGDDDMVAPFGFGSVVVVRCVRGVLSGLRRTSGVCYVVMWGLLNFRGGPKEGVGPGESWVGRRDCLHGAKWGRGRS